MPFCKSFRSLVILAEAFSMMLHCVHELKKNKDCVKVFHQLSQQLLVCGALSLVSDLCVIVAKATGWPGLHLGLFT